MSAIKKNENNKFRLIRMYSIKNYNEFCKLCEDSGTNATREINDMIKDSIIKKRLLSSVAKINEEDI